MNEVKAIDTLSYMRSITHSKSEKFVKESGVLLHSMKLSAILRTTENGAVKTLVSATTATG